MKPVNPNATKEAVALLDYLYKTVEEGKIITGQHTQTNPMEEVDYIYEVTGKILEKEINCFIDREIIPSEWYMQGEW